MNNVPDWAAQIVSPLDQKLGFVLEYLSPERVVGSIPVEGNQQPFGALHGGATAVLIETLGSMGALAHGRASELVGVGVDLNVTHLRAARAGRVRGTATAAYLGRSTATYTVEVAGDDGRLTAVGRLTCRWVPEQR